jgi:hypothetical protein
MFKKHRGVLIVLFVLFVGVSTCFAVFGAYYANRDASIRVNGFQIDFEYDFAMDVNVTHLKITRPDGKNTRIMQKVCGNCTRLTIQHADAKIYFLCLEDTLLAETDYLDTETMLLYDGERDETPTLVDSLDFH